MQPGTCEPLVLPLGSSGQRIVLSTRVLDHWAAHRQSRPWRAEAGGQLFAALDRTKIDIVEATGPRRTDRRSRRSYVPDVKREAVEIRRMHHAGFHYVGDWHTHPQTIPSPSGLDIASLQQCFGLSKHDLNAFLLVVVGRAPFPDGLFVAAIDARGVYPLEPRVEIAGAPGCEVPSR